MNILAAINGVVDQIHKGSIVRIKHEYEEDVTAKAQADGLNIKVIRRDEKYTYLQKESMMSGFSAEEMAACVHDNNGNPVSTEEGVVSGYNKHGQSIAEVISTNCVARQVTFTDRSKNEYYIGTASGGIQLLDPIDNMARRDGWMKCTEQQFGIYLNVCRTGIKFQLHDLKNQLRLG